MNRTVSPLINLEKKDKLPIVVVVVADKNNFTYAQTMIKSLRHFHDWPIIIYTDASEAERSQLPSNTSAANLTPYLEDPAFFYRATPIIAEPLLNEYELVLKLDADQLILGDLSYVLETKDYDIGVVLNANRTDWQTYGWVELGRIGILPIDYFNCGFVAMRSKAFVHNWLISCFTEQFNRMQYKEQDLLNLLCYFGNWNVRCFDHGDGVKEYSAWHGLIAKGETPRAVLRNNRIFIPKGLGDTPYPPVEMDLKALHLGGGRGVPKDNWAAHFPPDVWEYIQKEILK